MRGMNNMESGLRKFYWGFFFIMLSFRIQGFDILPDFVGYIFFALGFSSLSEKSEHFRVAAKFNMPLLVISLFSIYQWPTQAPNNNSTLMIGLGVLVSVILFALNLYVVFNLFMGIHDIISQNENGNSALAVEAEEKWKQYKILQIAAMGIFLVALIPIFNFVYIIAILIASLVVLVRIMGFIKRCEKSLYWSMQK
jgi:hypothetical protein